LLPARWHSPPFEHLLYPFDMLGLPQVIFECALLLSRGRLRRHFWQRFGELFLGVVNILQLFLVNILQLFL